MKDVIFLTGVSGAGKSTAMSFMEDIGYYCIDNMPAELISTFMNLMDKSDKYNKIAIVTDVRSKGVFNAFCDVVDKLKYDNDNVKIIYLDIKNHVALKRYKLTRRKHPFADKFSGSIEDALNYEKEVLAPVRLRADYVIDTSDLTSNQLRNRLTNPYWVESMREKTGLDQEVYDYVFSFGDAQKLLEKTISLLDFLNPLYIKEGKSQIVIAIGCTGGNHRSVAIAEALKKHFVRHWDNVSVNHRDINRK